MASRHRGVANVLVAVIAMGCAACATEGPGPTLPASWSGLAAEPRHSRIEMRPDGTGTFTNVPVWTETGSCSKSNTEPFSGDITWKAHDSRFTVDAGGRHLTLWADTGYFMSLDWSKVMLDVCGTEAHGTTFLAYG